MKEKSTTSSKSIHYFVSVYPDNYGGLNVYNSSVHIPTPSKLYNHTAYIYYVGGSSTIQTSHDSNSIEIEVYNNGKTLRLLKFLFFIYKYAGILLTTIYITQSVLATPTLIDT